MKSFLVGFFSVIAFSVYAGENGKVRCILEDEQNSRYTLVSYETRENPNDASFLIMCSADSEHASCATLPALIRKDTNIEMSTSPNTENEYSFLVGNRFNKNDISHSVINTVRIRKGTGVESMMKIKYDSTEQRYVGFCTGEFFR